MAVPACFWLSFLWIVCPTGLLAGGDYAGLRNFTQPEWIRFGPSRPNVPPPRFRSSRVGLPDWGRGLNVLATGTVGNIEGLL